MSAILYYCVLVVYVLGQGAVKASTCIDHPFLDECLQRKAANRTNGFVTIADCKVTESTRGTIVLLGVYVGDDVLTLAAKIQLENTTQSAGTSNDCLTRQLRPKFTGSKGWTQRVDYGMCGVDSSKGYILLEYTCVGVVPDEQKLEFPPCKGKYNGNRIRIQNKDFPNVGVEAVTHPDHCECTINTAANILNITTYFMDITNKQSLSIINGKGESYVSKNLSKDDAMESYALNVTGPLTLNWTNSESARNTSKFWLEIAANGTRIEIDCEKRRTTTMLSTKRLTSISAPIAKTDVNPSTSETSMTSTLPLQSENTVSNSQATSSSSSSKFASPTKPGSALGVTPDGGHAMEAKSDLEDEDGSKFPILPIVIGLVLLLVIVIVCVAIAIYIKKKKAKQKVHSTEDKDELADSNNDDDKTETNCYEETVTNPSNTKFTAAATLIPATQFPPLSNQVPAVRSTPYDAIDQQNVREEEENEVTEERKKKKKKKKKKRKKKNAVFPEEELNDEPHNFQEETDNVTLGDNIDDN